MFPGHGHGLYHMADNMLRTFQISMKSRKKGVTMKVNHAGWLSWTVLLLYVLNLIVSGSEIGSCTWDQHLGNPERTAYTVCDGPDAPEILWKTSLSGEFDTPPLVVGDTLVVLKKNSVSHFRQSSLVRMNLYTGRITGQIDSEDWDPYVRFFSDGTDVYLLGSSPQSEYTYEIWRVNFEEKELVSMASIRKNWGDYHNRVLILNDTIVYPIIPLVCFSKSDFNVVWTADEFLSGHERAEVLFAAADESYIYIIVEYEDTEKIYALDIESGELIWLRDLPGTVQVLAVENSTLFVGGDHISAVDVDTGRTLWRFTPEGKVFCNLVIGPDYVFAADSASQIYAIDKAEGRLVWQIELEGYAGWTFLVGGGQFLYCARGRWEWSMTACFHTEDGTKVWEYEFPSEIYTQPALAKGILIIPLRRGEIYAFATYIVREDKGTTPSESPQPTTSPDPVPATQTPEPTMPPESIPISPEPTALPESPPPRQSSWILTSAGVISAGILAGILIAYYLFKRKKS